MMPRRRRGSPSLFHRSYETLSTASEINVQALLKTQNICCGSCAAEQCIGEVLWIFGSARIVCHHIRTVQHEGPHHQTTRNTSFWRLHLLFQSTVLHTTFREVTLVTKNYEQPQNAENNSRGLLTQRVWEAEYVLYRYEITTVSYSAAVRHKHAWCGMLYISTWVIRTLSNAVDYLTPAAPHVKRCWLIALLPSSICMLSF